MHTWGLLLIFFTLLGSVYLRVIFNLLFTLLGSVRLGVIFNLLYTLLGYVHLRVTYNLFYTLLGSVYLRVISKPFFPYMAVALDDISKCEFAHNDLKCNHDVLEKREDQILPCYCRFW